MQSRDEKTPDPFLFVYGTLMRGLELHPHLHGARFEGRGTVRGRLYDLGPFPGMVPSERHVVWGELYRLADPAADLERLDRVEAAAGRGGKLFVRRQTTVRLRDGSNVPAWVYWYDRRPAGDTPITGGDYRAHRRG